MDIIWISVIHSDHHCYIGTLRLVVAGSTLAYSKTRQPKKKKLLRV